ncbi:diacylglycerol/lipid kinase family protein [Corynebacterium pseudotuberculosis]|uniref:diacylglycerol/lipid kinase family protein n=1 Tax=Corynebacterium pseudotuberculosis TaxID=1719 RepID=UPI00061A1124|nr:diacylglycerol kinase family protein [Corynebacterium pseudotuberculosis]AKC74489.1 Diacylglycerol kinase, catalytic region [Corynebacterium pseudotuberculosis]
MRALLIANPNSTTQDSALFGAVIPLLRSVEGLVLHAKFTHYQGHATQICAGLSTDDVDVVIAVGGDGTVNEIINGLLGPAESNPRENLPTLAVIPTGSANVFARALGFPPDPIQATEVLVDALEHKKIRNIDLGTWGKSWFAVNAGFGIDADVIVGVERVRKRGAAATPLRYLHAALVAWRRIHRHPPRMRVRVKSRGGELFEHSDLPLLIASNTNPWTFLGPVPVVTNPRNSFDLGLGLFGLTDLSGPGGVAAMAHLVGFGHNRAMKRWFNRRIVRFDDAIDVEITCAEDQSFQADGEFVGKFDGVRLGAVADALKVYAPTHPVKANSMSKLRLAFSFFDPRM